MTLISNLSDSEKAGILSEFTGELIIHSLKSHEQHLRSIEKTPVQRHQRIPYPIQMISKNKLENSPLMKKFSKPIEEYNKSATLPTQEIFIPRERNFLRSNPPLIIPTQKLPERFQYLKPIISEKEIDLGKLNKLLKDSMVAVIECNGPEQEIIVNGRMGRKRTGITLDKEEINAIIETFSMITKIPVSEGVYNVVYGKYQFSAIISEMLSAKFIIKKMNYNPNPVFR
ncbi:hypothetical protein HY448_00640 [Candidatus Pacearchaeota archaeon]|nr:hypothetical protein [Candidatus Pacearchaeota archaeon]